MYLAERVLAFSSARETVRRILMRRRDLVVALDQQRRKRRRRISVRGPGHLWGADLTVVWILGFFPVSLLGIVDYHGTRLVALERLRWPTGAEVARVFERAFIGSGAPLRVLTDRGAVFGSPPVRAVFATKHVGHTTTWPAHPWTNRSRSGHGGSPGRC
jgi:transposase InsO family protein